MKGPGPENPRREFQLPRSSERLAGEIEDELRFHMEERIEEFVAQGMSREDAVLEAKRRFGDMDQYRESARAIDQVTLRQERRANFLQTLIAEGGRARRALVRDRAFSVIAVFTLALGIAATTAIYSVLDAVVLESLPYDQSERLVAIRHPATVPGSGERHWGLSPGGYFGFRRDTPTLQDIGVYATGGFTVTSSGDAELIRSASITATLFNVLRARPALGRLLIEGDDIPNGPNVVVLGYDFWQRRFGGSPDIIGTLLETDIGNYEIVGVAERGLTLPVPGPFSSGGNLIDVAVDAWRPLGFDPAGPFYNNHPFVGIGRLADGASVEDAERNLRERFARIVEELPDVYSPGFISQYNFRVSAVSLRDAVLGPTVPRAVWMLFASVILVLAIAAANVGNLFLIRVESRRREAAVRSALGADKTHLAAHYLAEAALICISATAIGIALAGIALKVLPAFAPADVPRLASAQLSAGSTAAALAIGFLLTLTLGLVPLLRKELDLGTLRDGGRGLSPSKRQRFVRHALVVSQMALTLVLLAGAGLMFRSFNELRKVEPGFQIDGVLAFDVALPFSRYDTREKALVIHQELQRRLAALPGVLSVGAGPVPLEWFGAGCSVVFRENRPYEPDEQTPCVSTPTALPGYFDAAGIEVRGRMPDWNDIASRSQAAVVTEALATRLWPGEDAIGKGIATNWNSTGWYRIVGVVPSMKAESFDSPPTEAVFYAGTGLVPDQRSSALNYTTYFVRTELSDPMSLIPSIRSTVREVESAVPVINPRSMASVATQSIAQTTFLLILLATAATIALLLSAVGIYGVISYMVTQRRSEIGIRMALGADMASVVRMVVRQSLGLAVIGMAVGVVIALAGSRAIASLLYSVSPGDPVVLSVGVIVLLATTLLASWEPARRAARVDPGEAVRG